MDTLDIFLICVPVGLLITWRLLTGSTHQHRDERRATDSVKGGAAYTRRKNIGHLHSRYEGKQLRVCNVPCRAAIEQRNHVFLASEAPPLPLPECDRKEDCNCRYEDHHDRRTGKERRYPSQDIAAEDQLILPDSAVTTQDRRGKKDRRGSKVAARKPVDIT